MTVQQWRAVGVCVFLNIIDGFDILVMSTAAAAVGAGLGLSVASLGLVLSASLAGMTLGALLLAPLADRFGRRPLLLVCLLIQLVGMVAAGFSATSRDLICCRLITGLGVGGMMPVLNTIVAEVTTPSRRNVAITLQAMGYPAGGLAAALIGRALMESHGWRLLLQSACVPVVVALFLVVLFLPESVSFLLTRRPTNGLLRVNSSLTMLGKNPLADLPSPLLHSGHSLRALLSAPYTKILALFAATTFLTQFSFYFFLSWLPTVLQAHLTGGTAKSAGSIALNLGGMVGDLIFGALSVRVRARTLTLGALLISFSSVALLGPLLKTPIAMSLVLIAGAALFAAMAGIYATAPEAFPTLVRASGTGFAFSLGRFGGALSPLLGGVILSSSRLGLGLGLLTMGLPLVVAAALLTKLRTVPEAEPTWGHTDEARR
jgi:MFS family permease